MRYIDAASFVAARRFGVDVQAAWPPSIAAHSGILVTPLSSTDRPPWWSDRKFLLVLGMSLVLKVVLTFVLPRQPYLDEWAYHNIAIRWLEGGKYPTTFRPPLYPALLALSLASGLRTMGLRLAQTVMSTLTLIPVYRIAQRTYGPRVARVAAALVAFDPVLVMFSNRLWSETVFILLLMLILDLLTLGRATPRRWALAGVLFGLAALTRPVIFTALPLLALWTLLQARRDGRAWGPWAISYAVLAVVCTLVILPWTVRNARATGAFILIDSNGPFNFLVGTQPDAAFVDKDNVWTKYFGVVGGDSYEHAVKLDPARAQSLAMTAARQNIAADPGRFVRKSLWEAGHLWTADSFLLRHLRNSWYGPVPLWAIAGVTVVSVSFFMILVVAGFAGLSTAPPGPYRGVALLLLIHSTVLFGLVYSLSRYLLPLHAVLAIPAAAALVAVRSTAVAVVRDGPLRRRAAFWAALLAVAIVWIADLPKLADTVTTGGVHYPDHRSEREKP